MKSDRLWVSFCAECVNNIVDDDVSQYNTQQATKLGVECLCGAQAKMTSVFGLTTS